MQNPHLGITISALAGGLTRNQRLLGLDVGSKTIGVAVSDPTRQVATPLQTIARTRLRHDLEQLATILAGRDIGGVVVGLPVSMHGTEGPRCQSVRQFAADLARHCGLPVAFWDERLSTRAVERMLIDEADVSRRRRRQVVDRLAAAYILQGALDLLSLQRSSDRS
jgi:putative Holliday junction resolvase